jgi:hypothetical protein
MTRDSQVQRPVTSIYKLNSSGPQRKEGGKEEKKEGRKGEMKERERHFSVVLEGQVPSLH